MTRTYTVEELFSEIPGDPDHILLTFPLDLTEKLGWKENDEIAVGLHGDSLYFEKMPSEPTNSS